MIRADELRRMWDAGDRGRALRNSLDHLDDLLESGGDLGWLADAFRSSGLDVAAFKVDAKIAMGDAKDENRGAVSRVSFIRAVFSSGDPWWAKELLATVSDHSRDVRALGIEVALALDEGAEALVDEWLSDFHDEEGLSAAVGWYVAAGSLGSAEHALSVYPGASLWRARLEVWRCCPERARTFLEGRADSPEVSYLRALIVLQEGDVESAEAMLREIVEIENCESSLLCRAWSWLATLLRRRGKYEEATSAADAANRASPRFTLAPRMERELAVNGKIEPPGKRPWFVPRWLFRGDGDQRTVADLEYADLLYPLGAKPDDHYGEALERAIEHLGGNRSATPTFLVNDRLAPLDLPMDPRHHGATVQAILRTRGAAALRRVFSEYKPEIGTHPLSLIYQGEVELWLGEYAGAEAIFRRALAIQRRTLWAWIGLGATRMFQGARDEALEIWREGVEVMRFEGPTLFVLRGECHRRLGMCEEARRDLETAIEQKPQRLSAHINLALLDGDDESLAAVVERCREFAPILMGELEGTPAEQLEGVLTAMRGNRSSSPDHMMYVLWGHVWHRAQGCLRAA